jgi:hypothetical protein
MRVTGVGPVIAVALRASTDGCGTGIADNDGMARAGLGLLALGVITGVGCGGDGSVHPIDGGSPIGAGCSDLFNPDMVRTYSIEIDPAQWQSMDAEFHDLAQLQTGNDFVTYHPIVFRLDQETVDSAMVKLHGQSSWLQTVMLDGERAKMQFTVSFDEVDPKGEFHGVDKLVFDMPRSDWTFLHDRLAHTWLRQSGIMAGCAASARLMVNGSFYGLYVVEEDAGRSVIKQFYPDNPDGDLWVGGEEPATNKMTADPARMDAFWNATDLAAVSAVVDLPGSLTSWAGEALLNDADGYYGGMHNFFLFDQGQKGLVFLPKDTDATFDWLAVFDLPGASNHPIFWWEARAKPAPLPGQHWLIVMSDADQRRKYAEAISTLLGRWDVAQIQGWIDAWSAQIAADVAADPRKWASVDDFNAAVREAREVVAQRPEYLRSFVACELEGTGEDKDGDGARWCDDCRDDDATIHLGAAEACNGIDDNCNGTVDEACL